MSKVVPFPNRRLVGKLHNVICIQTDQEFESRRIARAFQQVNQINARYDMGNVYQLISRGVLRPVTGEGQ